MGFASRVRRCAAEVEQVHTNMRLRVVSDNGAALVYAHLSEVDEFAPTCWSMRVAEEQAGEFWPGPWVRDGYAVMFAFLDLLRFYVQEAEPPALEVADVEAWLASKQVDESDFGHDGMGGQFDSWLNGVCQY